MHDSLESGRAAYERQAWNEAFLRLSEAEARDPLAPADLELLARSAYLTGREAECERHLARAHSAFLERGDSERAANCSFWLGFELANRGEMARAGGWFARTRRVLDEAGLDGVVRGMLTLPEALQAMSQSELEQALSMFSHAAEIGRQTGDAILQTLTRLGCGQVLVKMGRVGEGLPLLDEVMVAVTSGEVDPIVAGIVYCAVIEVCHEIYDLRRAREWTTALTEWCASQPELVPYQGQCLIRRAEIMQIHGAWPDALDHARRAGEWLTRPPRRRAAGGAYYRQGELHRLQGRFDEAEEAYRQASRWGRKPFPGLALLRLAQGDVDAAESMMRHTMDEDRDWKTRPDFVEACIQIHLAAGDVEAARRAADELSKMAERHEAPFLLARCAHAEGAVLHAEGRLREALGRLRTAWTLWRELEVPFESARSQVLIARVCEELGDEESARLELEAARSEFEHLNALPELEALESPDSLPDEAAATCGLTPREMEVLGLVATGKSNREIAEHLFISERTVERHVSSILGKLDVSSRAAATAYAYEHHIV